MENGHYALTSLYVYLTNRCNLRCSHCYISPTHSLDGATHPDEMTPRQILDVVDECVPLGLQTVKFTGGEPFLRSDFLDLCEGVAARNLRINIESNGTLLSEETVARLRTIRLQLISVSLDSLDEEKHDHRRGVRGAFQNAVSGLRRLVRAGLRPQIVMALGKDNIGEAEKMCRFAKREGAGSVKLNPVTRTGPRAEQFLESYGLSFEEVYALHQRLSRMREEETIRLHGPLPPAFNSLRILRQEGVSSCDMLHILGLLADGSFGFCGVAEVCGALRLGHVSTHHVADLWASHEELLRARCDVPDRLEGICERCIFRRSCLGHCRAQSYYEGKGFTAPNELCQEAYVRGLFPPSRLVNRERPPAKAREADNVEASSSA